MVSAQDVHFSQIGNSALNLNPALVGAFDGDQRYALNIRQQTANVSSPFLQSSVTFDKRIRNREGNLSPWSFGFLANYNRIGDVSVNLAQASLALSYSAPLSSDGKSLLTIGGMVGAMERSYRAGELWLDNRLLLRDGMSSMVPSDEVLGDNAKMVEDFSLGANFHLVMENSRTTLDFGVGMFHISEPEVEFSNGIEGRLQTRYSIYLNGVFEFSKNVDLLTIAVGHLQNPYEELILGGGARFHLSQVKTKETSLQVGILNRPGEAIVPTFGLNRKAWQIQLSFDPTDPNPEENFPRRGGVEVSATYIFRQAPQLTYCRVCPTYM